MPRHILPLAVLLFLGGCYGPSGWSLRLEEQVECGMTVEEVQALTPRPLREHEALTEGFLWDTHFIVGAWEQVEVNLGFEDGKLRYVQVHWLNNLMSVASYPVIDLCADEGAEPDAATEVPS